MPGTYKATGINLKGMPMGESDRLLTILTKEFGLIRVVAPGARKHQSLLRGRSGLFVVNDLLIAQGKSLDKIVQAESISSYPGLSQDLRRLTVSQYLAELVLCQALSNQPQDELFDLFKLHLELLEKLPGAATLPKLVHATFHLLALAGVAPQVNICCLTQKPLVPNFVDQDWRVGFSASAGGTVNLSTSGAPRKPHPLPRRQESNFLAKQTPPQTGQGSKVIERETIERKTLPSRTIPGSHLDFSSPINAVQLALLQLLPQPQLIQSDGTLALPLEQPLSQPPSDDVWLSLERVLRQYAQYHFDRPIRSAALIETSFLSLPQLSP
ncbi:MAG TPA: DNA repair protein RecO [Crinalium sp.]|jgi:DNA repair protein RecO (recombination protein O)